MYALSPFQYFPWPDRRIYPLTDRTLVRMQDLPAVILLVGKQKKTPFLPPTKSNQNLYPASFYDRIFSSHFYDFQFSSRTFFYF
jgi:hypothetical protein